jgi:hypothetical protein
MKLWKKSPKDTATVVPVPGSRVKDKDEELAWVNGIQNVVRPAVAVIVLIMCAPGEHYLAHLAGWNKELSWGMPAVLTMYAGVAAVVATKRGKGAPGKKTAVGGAIVSIVLAMAAQPIAHLYGSGWQPGDIWTYKQTLTVVVSCIPALVFGHLLHLAASPAGARALSRVAGVLGAVPSGDSVSRVPAGVLKDTSAVLPDSKDTGDTLDTELVPSWDTAFLSPGHALKDTADVLPAGRDTIRVSQDTATVMDRTRGHDGDIVPTPVHDPYMDGPEPEDTDGDMSLAVPAAVPLPSVRRTADGSVSSFIQDILVRGEDTDNTTIKALVREKFGQDTKDNTINTSIRRARRALDQSA